MPIATLVKVSPMDTATGSRVDIYLSNMGDADMGARVNGLGGNVWVPALTTSPVLSMRTWNGDFTAAVEPGEARLAFTLGPVKRRVPAVETLYWAGAPIEVYAEEVGTAWPWTARFAGNVRDYAGSKRKWTLTAAVDERKFARNVLTASYFGTGGIEGGDSLKGKVKPLVLGWATNVEPVLIDAVNNVYQFSGYGPIEGVTTLYERGSAFPASTGDYASYSALVAATIPNGGWATSLAYGLIRLGAPQYGVITGDVKGHKVGASTPRLPGAVISALATIAGVSTGDLNTTSLTAFDTGVPYPINLFIDGQVEFADMAREIALSCNWVAGISLKGKFFAAPVSLSPSAAITLNAQGAAKPQVLDTNEKSVSLPYWKTVMGAARVWRVHSADEIASSLIVADSIVGQGDLATQDRDTLPFGTGNRVRFSLFEKGLAGWTMIYNPSSLAAPTYTSGVDTGLYYAKMAFSFTATSQVISFGSDNSSSQYLVPVTAGEWLAASIGVGFTGPVATVGSRATIYFRNAAGSYIGSVDLVNTGTSVGGFASLHRIIAQAPANATSAVFEVYATSNGAGAASITLTKPSIMGVASNQTAFPEFAPGPSSEFGADVTSSAQIKVEMTTDRTVPATYLGDVSPTDLGNVLWTPVVQRGATAIKVANGTTYALSNAAGGTFAVNNTNGSSTKGNVTISAMTANVATVDLVVTVDGVAQPKITLRLTKQLAAPPSGGGGGGSGTMITWSGGEFVGIDTTSYTAVVSPVKTITLASGESLYGQASLDYFVSGIGAINRTMTFKWQYSVAGANSWSDFATGVTGSWATSSQYDGETFEFIEPVPGYAYVAQTKSGLGAGDYDIRLVGICNATGRTCAPGGVANVEAKV